MKKNAFAAIILLIGIFLNTPSMAQKSPEIEFNGTFGGMGDNFWTQYYGLASTLYLPISAKFSIGIHGETSLYGKYVHYFIGDPTSMSSKMKNISLKARINVANAGKFRFYGLMSGGMIFVSREGDIYMPEANDKSVGIGPGFNVSLNLGKGISYQIVQGDFLWTKESFLGMDRKFWPTVSTGIRIQLRNK